MVSRILCGLALAGPLNGANEVEKAVAASSGIDEGRYVILRQSLPHLREAAALLTPLVEELAAAKDEERKRATRENV